MARPPKLDDKEERFFIAFYSSDSPTRANAEQSAIKAGYAAITARTQAQRVIKKFNGKKFLAALEAVGVTPLMAALRVRQMIETADNKEALSAIRLYLASKGEATGEGGSINVNANGNQVMVVVGASRERIAALRSAAPQPTREELERLQNERVNERLERLRSGETFVAKPHSKAQLAESNDAEAPILVQPSSPEPSGEQDPL